MDPAKARRRLLLKLEEQGHLQPGPVREAMDHVAREAFLPPSHRRQAYEDIPLAIGHGQTISAPHMVAIMTEALELRPGLRVLEVGTGSGYQAAILSRLLGETGTVVTIERLPELADAARRALEDWGCRNVEVLVGDGSLGAPERAPFDRILVTAAAPHVPAPLLEQLAPRGLLLVPVGQQTCDLVRVHRSDVGFHSASLGLCAFVPLVGAHGQGPPGSTGQD